MNMKRLVYILIGVVLIAFGVGALSLRHNENLRFTNFNPPNGIINISRKNKVNIGSKGLEVMDGDNYVSISWDGIKVTDGNEKVSIGWDGIKINDGHNTKVNIGKNNWFNFRDELEWFSFNEEKFIEINNEKNINILSTFINMEIISDDRKDIKITCKGNMKANIEPQLKIDKKIDEIEIKLENETTNNYTVTDSDVLLRIFIPKDYSGNIKTTSSSSDIYIENLMQKNLNINSNSGNISVKNTAVENFNINSSSGDIQIYDSNCDNLKSNTSSGNIEIENSTGIMDLQSSSGNIKLDNKYNNKDIQIGTTSGNVYINFAVDASYAINTETTSGSFRNYFSMNVKEKPSGNKGFNGKIGSGENNMEIKTISGDIEFNME